MTPKLNFTLAEIRDIVMTRKPEILDLPSPWNKIVLQLLTDWTVFAKSDLEGIREGMAMGALFPRDYEVWYRDPNSPDPATPATIHAVSAEDAVFQFQFQHPTMAVCSINPKVAE